MPQTKVPSPHPSGKALYILLCALLGGLLFLVLQRSAALIVYILLTTNYQGYSFGLNPYQFQLLDWGSLVLAMLFGFWYGTWLGLHWYDLVYGEGRTGILFHGFKGMWMRSDTAPAAASPAPAAAPAAGSVTVTAKPTVKTEVKTADKQAINNLSADEGWDFDDLLKQEIAPPKSAAPKPAVTVRRSRPAKRKTPAKRNGTANNGNGTAA